MWRILATGLLLACVLVLQGGGVSSAADDEVGVKRQVVTGCVHELAAVGRGNGVTLHVRLQQPDGSLTPLATVKSPEVEAILHTAFLTGKRVTVIFKVTESKLVAKQAILRHDAPSCEKPAAVSRSTDAPEQAFAGEEDAALRSTVPCVWPDAVGEPRRPSLLLEEIRTWARSAQDGTEILPADRTAIVSLTQQIEALNPATVGAASWPWPYFHLRSVWGKAAFAHEQSKDSPASPLGEWMEVKLALQKLLALDETVPEGLVLGPFGTSVWPHEERLDCEFPPAHELLQNLSELGVKAFEGGHIDELEFIQLLTEIDRCLNPGLESHFAPIPVCEYDWPAPYRRLVGIWGKALYAQGVAPTTAAERQAEWDEILLGISAFPDELETPRGG